WALVARGLDRDGGVGVTDEIRKAKHQLVDPFEIHRGPEGLARCLGRGIYRGWGLGLGSLNRIGIWGRGWSPPPDHGGVLGQRLSGQRVGRNWLVLSGLRLVSDRCRGRVDNRLHRGLGARLNRQWILIHIGVGRVLGAGGGLDRTRL